MAALYASRSLDYAMPWCCMQITRKAAAMPNRSVDEMMDGGRSRRDEWLEQQRAVQQMRELEGATFKPQTNTKNNYAHVSSTSFLAA